MPYNFKFYRKSRYPMFDPYTDNLVSSGMKWRETAETLVSQISSVLILVLLSIINSESLDSRASKDSNRGIYLIMILLMHVLLIFNDKRDPN